MLPRVSRMGATLLVGNKADLVKKRRVKQGGIKVISRENTAEEK